MLKEDEIIGTLDRVDWNFPGSSTPKRTVHSFHRFPGNFIPQIPAYLVQLLSDQGDLVFDPFCGSGTTGIEALQLGRQAWLSDVNRASIQVTTGKIAATTHPDISKELKSLLPDLEWEEILRSDQFGDNNEGNDPELATWFDEDTLAQLRYIWKRIERTSSQNLRFLLEVIFSDTLFACASLGGSLTSTGKRRHHHWGWVADNVQPKQPLRQNATRIFRERIRNAVDVLQAAKPFCSDLVTIRREDAKELSIPDCSADLVVTSPPYFGMIDYALANRFAYLWMGWSLQEDKEAELGARYKRRRRLGTDEYLESMAVISKQITKALRPGRYCAIVIGSSRQYPEVANKVIELFGQELDILWGPKSRTPTRRRISDRQGREPTECICVLRRATLS